MSDAAPATRRFRVTAGMHAHHPFGTRIAAVLEDGLRPVLGVREVQVDVGPAAFDLLREVRVGVVVVAKDAAHAERIVAEAVDDALREAGEGRGPSAWEVGPA